MNTVGDIYGCTKYAGQKGFIAGLECEIEAVLPAKMKSVGIFVPKEDGSLRNNGCEFVSAPAERATLMTNFINLQKYLGLDMAQDPFSQRTSVHVHVNVSSLTPEQAKNMFLLYALFEEFFFSMVKPDRRTNIHCVPLTETHLPMYYNRDIMGIRDRWSKYSALNLLRLSDLGTFEFRHHHGTGSVEDIDIWLRVLENLFELSKEITIDFNSLTSQLMLEDWFKVIFSPSPKTMMLKPTMMNIISNSLIDVKFSTIKVA